jgi:potassium efflux system protein
VFSHAKYVSLYPITSAVIVAFAIVPNFYDHPPVIVLELFFLVLIWLYFTWLRKPARKSCTNYLRILFVLAVVYSFSNLFVEVSNTDRVIVLILALIATIVSIRFLKRLKKHRKITCLIPKLY